MGKASVPGQARLGTDPSGKATLHCLTHRQSCKLNHLFPFPPKKSRFAVGIWRKFQCRAKFITIGSIHYRRCPNIAEEEIHEHKVQAQSPKFHKKLNFFLTNIFVSYMAHIHFKVTLFVLFCNKKPLHIIGEKNGDTLYVPGIFWTFSGEKSRHRHWDLLKCKSFLKRPTLLTRQPENQRLSLLAYVYHMKASNFRLSQYSQKWY